MTSKFQTVIAVIVSVYLLSGCSVTEIKDPAPSPSATTAAVYNPYTENMTVKYIGNINSKVFHKTDCWWIPQKNNQIEFYSREEAVQMQYKPCENCNP